MFIGNNNAVKLLERIIKSGKISHVYLFSGPESVGKLAIAKIFAKGIMTRQSFASILSSMKVNDKNAILPDLIILEPEIEEKKGVIREMDIKIEKVREIQKKLSLFPYKGEYKVLIVNNAHRMTEESQNALLKTLEEPNETSIIVLVTHEEGKILPTVKSRCQKIKFNLVPANEIKEKSSASDEIISLSLGRPGLAIRMNKDEEEFDLRTDALKKLRSLPKAGINQRLKMAEELSKDISGAIKKMELWIWSLHDPAQKDIRLFKVIEKIEKSLDEIKNTNANTRLILENLLLNL